MGSGDHLIRKQRADVPFGGIRAEVDPERLVRGAQFGIEKVHSERPASCQLPLRHFQTLSTGPTQSAKATRATATACSVTAPA